MQKNNPFTVDVTTTSIGASAFMTRVYQWMTIGVLLTAFFAMYVGNSEELATALVRNSGLRIFAIILQFGIVLAISFLMNKISSTVMTLLFLIYSALTGVTLSIIVMSFTASSIQSAFFTTSIGFGGLTLFGYVTKKDLSAVGSFCMMGLFGIIGYSLLAMFFPSMMGGSAHLIFSIVGLLIFAGLTAYDTQKIKTMGLQARDGESQSKMAILGALTLYLDFINMFLFIIQLTGDRRK